MTEKNRQCLKCYLTKPITKFPFSDVNKRWRRNDCKECRSIEAKKWALKNPERVRQNGRNFDARVANGKYPHRLQATRIRHKNRHVVANIHTARNETFIKHFGCSKKVFVNRFERYFEKYPGMGWHNYGAWHMDHIKPMKEFKLDTKASIKLCNHYTNLRPQWALNNMQKSSKYEVEQTI